MEITLKKIEHSPLLSEETNAFTAEVHFNGQFIARAKNSGTGGCTDIFHEQGHIDTLQKLEVHYRTLPPFNHPLASSTIPMSLDFHIEMLIEADFRKRQTLKLLARLDRDSLSKVVILNKAQYDNLVVASNISISIYSIKYPVRFDKMTKYQRKKIFALAQSNLKPGEFIYNKNLK